MRHNSLPDIQESPMPSTIQGIGDGSSAPSTSKCPLSATDKLVNEYIKSVRGLVRNEPLIAPKTDDKLGPAAIPRGHNHRPAISPPVSRRDTPSGITSDAVTDRSLRMLRHVNTRDDYDRQIAKLWAYRKRKSMRRTERVLARAHGTEDKRVYALSKEDREEFSDGSGGSDEETLQEKQCSGNGNKCNYHPQCPCGAKGDASCWRRLVQRRRSPLPKRPKGAYIPRSDNSDLNLDLPLPQSFVTDFRKYSHVSELKFATEALINTLAHFEDLLPLEISIHVEKIRGACANEGDQQNDSTLDAFAQFILEWANFPNLSRNIALYLNGNFAFSGWGMKMQNWLWQAYGGRIFQFDEIKMREYPSQPEDYLQANWPTYHWVVSSWIVTLAIYCRNYHEARVMGAQLPADWVFPQPFYPVWARWQCFEKWKC